MSFLLSIVLTKAPFVRLHLFLLSSPSQKRGLIKDIEILCEGHCVWKILLQAGHGQDWSYWRKKKKEV